MSADPKITWTFTLTGPCEYCGKTASRQRSFVAPTEREASVMADRAMASLCHRKCGGY